jgi:prepilin-type processing-associated H-X9-DG protein
MIRRADLVVLALIVLPVGGLILILVGFMREAQAQEACLDNLRHIGLGLGRYQEQRGHFPRGTVPNPALPPDRRLSWYVGAWDYSGDMTELILDREEGWESDTNRKVRRQYRLVINPQEVDGDPPCLMCPANPNRARPGTPGLTHYVGVAGIGEDAALLSVDDPRAGVFGYDRTTRLEDIKDGTSTTSLVVETGTNNGPWTAGGRPTVRGLEPDRLPYLGRHGQFSSYHRDVTNVLFVDGSVRSLRSGMSPEVLQALATIAGHEEVGQVGDE